MERELGYFFTRQLAFEVDMLKYVLGYEIRIVFQKDSVKRQEKLICHLPEVPDE